MMTERKPIQPGASILVCMPWRVHFAAIGGEAAECPYCGASIVISTAGRELMEEKDLTPVCITCVDEHDGKEQMRGGLMTPGVRAEIKRVTGMEPEDIIPEGLSFDEITSKLRRQAEREQDS